MIRIKDKIVQQVVDKFAERSNKGIEKYGTTLEDNNADMLEWLTHLQEEMMDGVLYIERMKVELKKKDK
jgi:hypothetical protein